MQCRLKYTHDATYRTWIKSNYKTPCTVLAARIDENIGEQAIGAIGLLSSYRLIKAYLMIAIIKYLSF